MEERLEVNLICAADNYRTAGPGAQWHIAIFPFEGGDAPLIVFPVVGAPVGQLHRSSDGRRLALARSSVSSGVVLVSDAK